MIEIKGRYMVSLGSESTCVARISSSNSADIIIEKWSNDILIGTQIICYLDDIGAVPGYVAALGPAGFTLQIEAGIERKSRINDRLMRLLNRSAGFRDQRSDPRIVPHRRSVAVRLSHGESVMAEIIDLSMSGVALAMAHRPDPDGLITVGKRFASVVRHLPDGIAARFKLPLNSTTFNENVVL